MTPVESALLLCTWGCVVANAGEVVAKVVRAGFVRANAAAVGVPAGWLPVLALLEGGGVAAMVVGLLGVPVLGLAGALGLVGFFVGAVVAHLRARVLHNLAFPLAFLALAVASCVHFAGLV